MKLNVFVRFNILVSLVCIALNARSGEFAVSPMLIELDSGERQTETFNFQVLGKKAGKIKIFMSDLTQQSSGHMAFEAVSGSYSGMANWVQLSNDEIYINEGERADIKGEIRIPSGVRGSHLAAVMVEEVKPSDASGFNVNVRYAIILNLSLSGRKQRLKSQFMDLALEEQDGNLFAVGWFENLSDRDAMLETEVQIRDVGNRLVGRVPLLTQSAWQRGDAGSRVFPGSRVKVYGPVLKNIEDGTYQLMARNRFGGRPAPAVREQFVFASSDTQEKPDMELVDINLPEILAAPSSSGIAMTKFNFENPYDRPVELIFRAPDDSEGAVAKFMPQRIQLAAGEASNIRLVQRWGERAPQPTRYLADLKIAGLTQEIEIKTRVQ